MVHAAFAAAAGASTFASRSLLLNDWLHWGCCEPFMCHQKQVSAFALLRIIVLPVSNSPAAARRVLILCRPSTSSSNNGAPNDHNGAPNDRTLSRLPVVSLH